MRGVGTRRKEFPRGIWGVLGVLKRRRPSPAARCKPGVNTPPQAARFLRSKNYRQIEPRSPERLFLGRPLGFPRVRLGYRRSAAQVQTIDGRPPDEVQPMPGTSGGRLSSFCRLIVLLLSSCYPLSRLFVLRLSSVCPLLGVCYAIQGGAAPFPRPLRLDCSVREPPCGFLGHFGSINRQFVM
jgi:hypothetical protein